MQGRNIKVTAVLPSAYTTTNAWANVTGLIVTAPEDGEYDIISNYAISNSAGDETNTRIAINGNPVTGCFGYTYISAGGICSSSVNLNIPAVRLNAGDVVSIQAIYYATSSYLTGKANFENNLIIIKRGL